MQEVFYNWTELHSHHRRLLDTLFEIQRDQHPQIRSITAAVFDGALNFREAYMEYIPNYPIAEYRIEDEMRRNPIFREFAEVRPFVSYDQT
jgi:RHO1 GDP-GTP exchange protein 1/2